MGNARGGRARVPIEKRIQDGTYKPSRHGTSVQLAPVVHSGELLPAPRHFKTAEYRNAWRSLVEPLSDAGLLQTADAHALEMATVALVEFRQAQAMIQKDGLFVSRVFAMAGEVPIFRNEPNPAIKLRDKAASEFRQWCARFGLTPSDRTSLGVQQIQGLTMSMELDRVLGANPRAAAK